MYTKDSECLMLALVLTITPIDTQGFVLTCFNSSCLCMPTDMPNVCRVYGCLTVELTLAITPHGTQGFSCLWFVCLSSGLYLWPVY